MTDTIPYEITGETGEIQFRTYPAVVLATVASTGGNDGFDLLFAYITGKNAAQNNISMTSPVITSQQIAMTSPVVTDAASMSFVMPPGKTRDDIPEPLDARVQISTVPAREVAIIRFSGYARKGKVAATEVQLREGLRAAGIEPVGELFLMRYNPPWTLSFLRRNEVGLEIKR